MKMHVGKWGNSLAIRLPSKEAAKLGIKEGDILEITPEALERLVSDARDTQKAARREAALADIRKGRITLPPDWKFDREEANWRPAFDRW